MGCKSGFSGSNMQKCGCVFFIASAIRIPFFITFVFEIIIITIYCKSVKNEFGIK